LDQIQNQPDSALSKVLSTPLGLALARDTYANADPADLLRQKLRSPTAVLDDIFGAFLEHAYPDRRMRDNSIRWMSWIASHMSAGAKGPTRDLPWWHLPRWIPARQAGLTSGVFIGVVSTAVSALAYLIGAMTEVLRNDLSARVVAVVILAPGLMAGLATCLLMPRIRQRTSSPHALVPRLPSSKELPLMLSTAFVGAVITLLTPLLLVALQVAVLHVFANANEIPFKNHNKELLILFILLAMLVGLIVGLVRVWRTPVADVSAGTPYSTYRADRRAARLVTLLVAALAGLAIVMAMIIESPFEDATHRGTFTIGLLAFLQSVAIFGWLPWATTGAAPQLRVAQGTLRLLGRGRVQFIPLLEDALVRQVLRQAGTMYQFRHAALQDYLATGAGLNAPLKI
jgi:hypothetical protein